jgi:UDP-3-O-[3-hydroxymyristoyl] glucosamine N-acyltransferase
VAYSVKDLAQKLDLPFQGSPDQVLDRVSSWREATTSSLVFADDKSHLDKSEALSAGCIIAAAGSISGSWNAIISKSPKIDFSRAAALLYPRRVGTGQRDASARVDPTAVVSELADLGAGVTLGSGVRIGERSILSAGVILGENCVVGTDCILHPHVVIYPSAVIGNRVIVHAGTVIGGDGFGYVFDGREHVKFPQQGGVVIEDDVEIGCNTTIDRGSLGTTRIGQGSKIDNLVQIAHNVQIGRGVVIAAQTGISGSTTIEDFAIIGGQVGFGDHAYVESGAVIGSRSGVLPGKIVRGGEVYWGVPVRPLREYKRLNALFGRLPQMKDQLTNLQERVERLEGGGRSSEKSSSTEKKS